MAFSYRLGLRTLLECLGKADKGREERDHSGQELHELGEIGLGITSHRMEGSARHEGCRQRGQFYQSGWHSPINSRSSPSRRVRAWQNRR